MERANGPAVVAIAAWKRLDEAQRALGEVLDLLGGLEQYVGGARSVVIKPNLTDGAHPRTGGTTHPELVAALVERLLALGVRDITVAEGTMAPMGLMPVYRGLGYVERLERYGVRYVDLEHDQRVEVSVPDPVYPGVLAYPRTLLDADAYITVPVLKTHAQFAITVAIKNAFGLLDTASRIRVHREYRVDEAIVDINRIRPPDLIVVDGYDGAEGIAGGTDFTRPAGARLIMAGADCVAIDRVAARIMAQNPNLRALDWAAATGLGQGDLARIATRGLPRWAAQRDFMTPAEALMEEMGNLTIVDLDSDSGTRCAVISSLARYEYMKLARPLTIVIGDRGRVPEAPEGGELALVGDAAARLPAGDDATRIPGDPPDQESLHRFYRERGLLCTRCHEVTRQALAGIAGHAMEPMLRVLCGGEEVHTGAGTSRSHTDLTLLVGDCMARYCRNVTDRVQQILALDDLPFLAYVPGCPPSLEEVEAGLARLRAEFARRSEHDVAAEGSAPAR